MKDERKVTTLRIDKTMYEQLEVIAKTESRSVNQQILYFLRQALKARATT